MAEYDLVESVDPCAKVRKQLRAIGNAVGEWAGIPMPLEGQDMVVEPSYQFASLFENAPAEQDHPLKMRNVFYSHWRRKDVVVYEEEGRVTHGAIPAVHSLNQILKTLGCSGAWGVEQEHRAIELLGTLLRHHTFKSYLMTGTFLESSRRSRVMYVFRRLRPTVALSMQGQQVKGLCALCMHPIGYYEDSWAGAMTPTDDVVAHLMLMRGDEAMFWRRCNQIPLHRPEAGL